MNTTRRRVWSLRRPGDPSWVPGLALDDILTCVQSEVLAGLYALSRRQPLIADKYFGGVCSSRSLWGSLKAFLHRQPTMKALMRTILHLEIKGFVVNRRLPNCYKRVILLPLNPEQLPSFRSEAEQLELKGSFNVLGNATKSQDCEDLY